MNNEIIFNITIYAGSNYALNLIYAEDDETPVDMRGWTVEATLREFAEEVDGTDFYCVSDANGVHIMLTPSQTAELGYRVGEYDVFITDPDNNIRVKLLRGRADIRPAGSR